VPLSPSLMTTTEDEGPDYTASIYGSLLVTTLIGVQRQLATSAVTVALTVLISIVVFWLAHSWAAIVNQRMRGRIRVEHAVHLAAEEAPMLAAAIVPIAALASTLAGASVKTAVDLALFASIAQLFLWGLAVGRAAHATWLLAFGVAAIDCLLGLVIVILEVNVLH
jgi:hypothetical protein